MKQSVKYKNRYSDEITFTLLSEKSVLIEGGEYYRFGFPNDYTKAYEEYCKDVTEDRLDRQQFEGRIFLESPEDVYPYKKYWHAVESIKDRINMVDPSGGPYLHSGHDLNQFGFERETPMIIDYFKIVEGQVVIIIK